jgi:hypothetical protein
MEQLKDKSNSLPPEIRQLVSPKCPQIDPVHHHSSPGRAIERPDQVEQSGLA